MGIVGYGVCQFGAAFGFQDLREPLVGIAPALNMTVPGIIAHQSALKNGETMAVPHFS